MFFKVIKHDWKDTSLNFRFNLVLSFVDIEGSLQGLL